MKRIPVNKYRDARKFNRTQQRTNLLNVLPTPMRGGIRL